MNSFFGKSMKWAAKISGSTPRDEEGLFELREAVANPITNQIW